MDIRSSSRQVPTVHINTLTSSHDVDVKTHATRSAAWPGWQPAGLSLTATMVTVWQEIQRSSRVNMSLAWTC